MLAIQSGEPGPIAQAIAGVDIALHDLAARRAGLPLWRHLSRDATDRRKHGGDARACRSTRAASTPSGPGDVGRRAAPPAGYTAFKLKVGFGAARDVDNLAAVRAAAGAGRRR